MIGYIYIVALSIAAVGVSILGAAFSISGLAKLFSGAPLAVMLMASALEYSKFVVAGFLHRTWGHLNFFYKSYLLMAVVLLSLITSMGIFGFLSDAYQTSSHILTESQIKIQALRSEESRNEAEVQRLKHSIDEIPVRMISKKMKVRQEVEPLIKELLKKTEILAGQIKQQELNILTVKDKVGPLIYIAKITNKDIDEVVKWLIFLFVGVFDPLAICLVIATGESLKLKGQGLFEGGVFSYQTKPNNLRNNEDKNKKIRVVETETTAQERNPEAIASEQSPLESKIPEPGSADSSPLKKIP